MAAATMTKEEALAAARNALTLALVAGRYEANGGRLKREDGHRMAAEARRMLDYALAVLAAEGGTR